MQSEFFGLQLSRQELMELHEALAQRALVEEDLRHEKGLECVHARPLLEKVTTLLSVAPEQEERVVSLLDEELWEHAWYRFTDEWAWYRAAQEVEKEIGSATSLPRRELQQRIERRYERDFETFVKEVEMPDEERSSGSEPKRKTA